MTDTSDAAYYLQGILKGDRRILAKAITLIESSRSDHQELGRRILDRVLPATGNAVRLGITGVPGAGKSTFIESLGGYLIERGHRIAVLAVDPSSKRSGGSVLADKTRMEKLAAHPRAFIRPSPSGGTLGGVARKTRESALLCEAAGFDVVIIETVGVGQSETAVASMVDFFLLLLIAGAGDELQGMKKGILELVDAVAITKADGDNAQRAEQARLDYTSAMHFLLPATPTWTPPVLTCSALDAKGIDDIWAAVLEHRAKMTATGELEEKRHRQTLEWMWNIIDEGLQERFKGNPAVQQHLLRITRDVVRGRSSATSAACDLLRLFDTTRS